ncbi:hydroxymethylbilane synthase [Bosea caraganae]|uniref:Porphobilinogen deaminase n=1 Tax=Bosea caraganae TaxID=2763117 RepID=A0A370L9M7_9HYPH|nr:hydroxymethylbilane synthase [Bosea caraganae]RDJ21956.1 hydroxymethylbilane synthase [Bosea caraganae]RDJ28012.1 hydroxymethylbilane synthase [Bosea caraganae]
MNEIASLHERQAGRFVIGTRGSPLALAQAHEFAGRLAAAHGWERRELPLDIIRTTGDAIRDRPLSEAGGKGLFTKEIDQAQLHGRIDYAIHSAKDLPNDLPDGLVIAGYLPREDVRDALISRGIADIAGLPQGAIVGSASLRRQAILKRIRPDLRITLLRGNVGTRLEKVAGGEIDATLLALAGLKRLGLAEKASGVLSVEECLPAVGQGAIAIVIRADDEKSIEALQPILCRDTGIAVAAERAFLSELDGSCRTPIAGHATVEGGRFQLRGLLLAPDGGAAAEDSISGTTADATALGAELGRSLRRRAPAGIYS